MAQIDLKVEHHLTLTAAEWRLVVRALVGRLKPEEVAPAAALQDALVKQRLAHAQAWAKKLSDDLGHGKED